MDDKSDSSSDSDTDSLCDSSNDEADTASDTDLESPLEGVNTNTDDDNDVVDDEVRHPPEYYLAVAANLDVGLRQKRYSPKTQAALTGSRTIMIRKSRPTFSTASMLGLRPTTRVRRTEAA
jgi:hypothetical protein